MIRLYFIGVGGSVPHPERGLPCLAIKKSGETILFDCGEGSQVGYIRAGLGVNKPLTIFITHLHGDHLYGLPPLLYSLSLLGRTIPVRIIGPVGLYEYVDIAIEKGGGGLGFRVEVMEVKPEAPHLEPLIKNDKYEVYARPAKHTIPSLVYVFREKDLPGRFNVEKAEKLGIPPGPLRKALQKGELVKLPSGKVICPEEVLGPPRPGIKVVYSGDTRPIASTDEIVKRPDILIHDSTFTHDIADVAAEKGHSTALEAAQTARRIGAKVLFLFHFSQRYKTLDKLREEARSVHRLTFCAEKGTVITVKKERDRLELTFTYVDVYTRNRNTIR